MPPQTEITAIYLRERIRFRGSDVAIIECSHVSGDAPDDADNPAGGRIEIKIECREGQFAEDVSYRFFGFWGEYHNKKNGQISPQFQAKTFITADPAGELGTIAYLKLAPHIGTATAMRLWTEYGPQAVQVLRENPAEVATKIKGLPEQLATEAAKFFRGQQALESCTIELMDLFDRSGLPKATVKRAIDEWGNRAADIVRRNPFRLLQFPGCGFLRCDELYHSIGLDPRRLKRQAICAQWLAQTKSNENVWMPRRTIEQQFYAHLGADSEPNFRRALELAVRANLLSLRQHAGSTWIADRADQVAETEIACDVLQRGAVAVDWPAPEAISVSDSQRAAIAQAFGGGSVAILTGGPGTGKTYCVARIITAAQRRWPNATIEVCAPTGKAAVRATQALAANGVQVRASTIHSLLARISAVAWDTGMWAAHLVIVDEASMVDADLLAQLLRSICRTPLLLVGDANQLPPVDSGAPLRDLIAAGVPCGELTEVRRNSGKIVEACAEIRRSGKLVLSPALNPDAGENLVLIDAPTPKAVADQIVETLRKIRAANLADTVWDCQVICALNQSGDLNRESLNRRLAAELLPAQPTGTGQFRVGEKVVCTANQKCTGTDSDIEIYIANGELGRVVESEKKYTVVRFDGSPHALIRMPIGTEGQQAIELAYAISCHKSQGSEWPIVIVAIDPSRGAEMVCSREWLYTAISRGKLCTILVGRRAVAEKFLKRVSIRDRKTFLTELISGPMPIEPQETLEELLGCDESRRVAVNLPF